MCEILPGQALHPTLSRGTEPCWVSHIRVPRRALKNPDAWAVPQDQLNQHLGGTRAPTSFRVPSVVPGCLHDGEPLR